MEYKWSFLFSLLLHIGFLLFLSTKIVFTKPTNLSFIRANIIVQRKNPKPILLPKKPTFADKAPLMNKRITTHKGKKYNDILKNLSQQFSKEIHKENINENINDLHQDYYEKIYALIKESFVVPPHILGPRGDGLMALIKIYLDEMGGLKKVEIKRGSSDEYFNKVVLDGINRVENFGEPPSHLKKSLLEDGFMVKLCPNKCPKK